MTAIGRERAITAFTGSSRHAAVARTGQRVRLRTSDCYDGQIDSAAVLRPMIDMERFNRATGPVRVEGIQAGDRALVRIHEIELDSQGVMALSPGLGLLGSRIQAPSTRILEVRDGRAWLADGIGIPVRPMIGVIGAATSGSEISTSTPDAHGGNLDTRHMTAGMALSLRARQEGLGLAIGDLHAVQGDGELGGTGVEIGGAVTISVDRIDERGELPVLVDREGIRILGSAPDFEDAVRLAFAEAVEFMAEWHGLPWEDAYRLTSITSQAEVSQLVNPQRTARLRIPIEWVRGTYAEVARALPESVCD